MDDENVYTLADVINFLGKSINIITDLELSVTS